MDGSTDKHDEANSRFSKLYERGLKTTKIEISNILRCLRSIHLIGDDIRGAGNTEVGQSSAAGNVLTSNTNTHPQTTLHVTLKAVRLRVHRIYSLPQTQIN